MHRGWLAATAFAFGENTIRSEKVRDQRKTDYGLFPTCFSILKKCEKQMIIELGDDIIRMWLEINQPTTKSIGKWLKLIMLEENYE